MNGRTGIGALLGAGILTLAAVGSVAAVPPTYTIDVSKTADPATVPAEGGDVEFTVWVENTGTGFFKVVNVSDAMVGCTMAYDSGDTNGDDELDTNETWGFTCTVADVLPTTINSASVVACHDGSVQGCNNENHNASGGAEVTVGLCETDCDTGDPGGTVDPGDGGGDGGADDTTPPSTDTALQGGRSGPTDSAWILIAVFGGLLGSLVVLRPTVGRRHR